MMKAKFAFLVIFFSCLALADTDFNFISAQKTILDFAARPDASGALAKITLFSKKPKLAADPADSKQQSLLWTEGYIGFENQESWTDQDSLAFEFSNPQIESIDINLEIKDQASKDYWTRVNAPLSVAAGVSIVRVPLALYVGEKARPGRALDLAHVRSVILARADALSGKNLFLRKVSLEKSTNAESLGLRAYDFGSDDTPVFPGFRAWTKEMTYSPERGYGLKNAKVWQPYKWANDGFQPDSLYRDSILIYGGEAIVDLPNGKYQIVMNIDHPGGYWGEYPLYHHRKVFAQDQLMINERMDRNQAADRYFYFLKQDDHFDEDVFDKYDPVLFHEKKFVVDVKDGHLKLRFEGDNCLLEPCFGLALSSLIIIPESKNNLGERFLKWVRANRKKEFNQSFQKILPTLPASDFKPLEQNGFYLFSYPLMADLSENQIPTQAQIKDRPVLQIARGQKASASFAIFSAQNSNEPFRIRLTPESARQWKNAKIQIGLVSRRLMRLTPSGHRYTVGEKFISELHPFLLTKNRSQRIWIEAAHAVDPKLKNLQLNVERGHQSQVLTIPVQILPFDLPEVEFPVGPFGSTVREAWWQGPENQYRTERLQKLSLEKMRETGLNSFSFSPSLSLDHLDTAKGAGFKLTHSEFMSQMMNSARKLGFMQVTAYNDLIQGRDLCVDSFSDAELEFLARELKNLSTRENWLPLTVLVCDEPVGANLPKAIARLKKLSLFNSPEVNYSAAFSLASMADQNEFLLWQTTQIPYLNLFNLPLLKTTSHEWVHYNSASRLSFGFSLFQLRELTSLKGRLAWTWNQNAANPFYALDSREDDYGWVSSTRQGNLLPTVFLNRHILEGLNDYRYARLLSQTLKTMPEDHSGKVEGAKILDEILRLPLAAKEPIPGDPLDQDTLETGLRSRIVSWLLKTHSEIITKEKIK